MVSVRARIFGRVAQQLSHPAGIVGRLLARGLNRGNRKLTERAVAALTVPRNAVVADVGFGGGVGLRLLLDLDGGAVVHGVDISSAMLERARGSFADEITAGRLFLHRASLTELPFADESLDGVITVNTIYFLDDLTPALRQLARTLKPTGRAVIGIGDPEGMKALPFTAYGFRLRSIAEIQTLAADAGLTLGHHHQLGSGTSAGHILVLEPTHGDAAD